MLNLYKKTYYSISIARAVCKPPLQKAISGGYKSRPYEKNCRGRPCGVPIKENPMSKILETEGLEKRYQMGEVSVEDLRRVNFLVEKGD